MITLRHTLSMLVLLAAGAAQADAAMAVPDDVKDKPPTLTVRGEAELHKPADLVTVRIGFTNEGAEAASTVEDNDDVINDVLRELKRVGLTDDELETGHLYVRPRYERRPRQPGEDWQPTITGYEVSNSVQVRTKQLDKTGEILEAAVKAGANTVEGLSFELADERTHRAEAIRKATLNARADAAALAEAADLALVRVREITLDSAASDSLVSVSRRVPRSSETTTPIAPGTITLRASVTIVYEIEGNHDPADAPG